MTEHCPNCGVPYELGALYCDDCEEDVPQPNRRERLEHEYDTNEELRWPVYLTS